LSNSIQIDFRSKNVDKPAEMMEGNICRSSIIAPAGSQTDSGDEFGRNLSWRKKLPLEKSCLTQEARVIHWEKVFVWKISQHTFSKTTINPSSFVMWVVSNRISVNSLTEIIFLIPEGKRHGLVQ